MSDFLWVEKYRPKIVSDTILPKNLKETFQKIVDSGKLPNMLFTGTAGLGKTTIAKAICNELNLDYIVINGSDEGRLIDTLRTKIKNFASTVSLSDAPTPTIVSQPSTLIQSAGLKSNENDIIVNFETEPAGAEVYVDGQFLCSQTPCQKYLAPKKNLYRK